MKTSTDNWKHSLLQQLRTNNQKTFGYEKLIIKYNQTREEKKSLQLTCSKTEEILNQFRSDNQYLEQSLVDREILVKKAERCDSLENELIKSLRQNSEMVNEITRLNHALEQYKKDIAVEKEKVLAQDKQNNLLQIELKKALEQLNSAASQNQLLIEERIALLEKNKSLNDQFYQNCTNELMSKVQLEEARRTISILEEKLLKKQQEFAAYWQKEIDENEKKRERASKQTASIVAENDKDGIVVIDMEDVSQLPKVDIFYDSAIQRNSGIRRLQTPKIVRRFKKLISESSDERYDSFNRTPIGLVDCTRPTSLKTSWDYNKMELYSSAFQPSGSLLAIGCSDDKVHLEEISEDGDRHSYASFLQSHGATVALQFNNEDARFLIGCVKSTVHLWCIDNTPYPKSIFTGHSANVNTCKFINGDRICTGSNDTSIRIWDYRLEKMTAIIESKSKCYDLVVTDILGSLISGHHDKTLKLWDSRSSKCERTIVCDEIISSLSYSDQTTQLLVGFESGTPQLIDVRQNKTILQLDHESFQRHNIMNKVILSPNGAYACVSSNDGSVITWDLNNIASVKILNKHTTPVTSISWSPNGRYVATTEKRNRAIIWN